MQEPERVRDGSEPWPPPPDTQSVEVAVGIPAYNEEVGIGSTVVTAKEHADCVVVVDDGSTDKTAWTARQAGAVVIRHPRNRGKGAAIDTLLEYAQEIECDALVLLDGDGQHVPSDIPEVAAPAVEGDADLVVGNRHHGTDGGTDTPRYRRVGQRVLDGLTRVATGTDVTDTQSGFRALSPAAIEAISPSTDGMGVESEMLDTAARHDLRIAEVPIGVRYEGIDGQTRHPITHGLAVGLRVLSLSPTRLLMLTGGLGLAAAGLVRSRGSRSAGHRRPVERTLAFLLGLVGGTLVTIAIDLVSDWGSDE